MKIPKIAKSMEYLDNDLIAEAANAKQRGKKKAWIKWSAIAASLAVVALAVTLMIPMLTAQDENKSVPAQDHYKDVTVQNYAIVWPWEYKTVFEKYLTLNFDGREFNARGREISQSMIGEKLGMGEASGQDFYAERIYTESFEVYEINDVSSEYLVAAKMEGKYCVFDAHAEHAPKTLGKLIDTYSLKKVLRLNKFSMDDKYFSLDGDSEIWEILQNCRDARAVTKEEDAGISERGESVSFTVTSEQLATYKVVLRISEDGYLWTNAFDYAYIYNIGTDAASSIIDYAKSKAREIAQEPYQHTVIGKIVEINDGYFLLDDTEICVDANKGRVYKILSTDIRVRRHFEFEKLDVGRIVVVYYDGVIQSGNLIDSAYGMSKAYAVSNDVVLIPE